MDDKKAKETTINETCFIYILISFVSDVINTI